MSCDPSKETEPPRSPLSEIVLAVSNTLALSALPTKAPSNDVAVTTPEILASPVTVVLILVWQNQYRH